VIVTGSDALDFLEKEVPFHTAGCEAAVTRQLLLLVPQLTLHTMHAPET
jgi:hypothetical protein